MKDNVQPKPKRQYICDIMYTYAVYSKLPGYMVYEIIAIFVHLTQLHIIAKLKLPKKKLQIIDTL